MKKWMARIVMLAIVSLPNVLDAQVTVLRYSHMNQQGSVAGKQADYFSHKVEEYTGGAVRVELYPASGLGSLNEQLTQVSKGITAIHHNTAGALASLFEDIAVLDTPYLFRDVDHLLNVVSPDSPVFKKLDEGLRRSGLRILYTFYFGTRVLTCDRPIFSPKDLQGVRIRAIPFPVYQLAVEALGGIPVPIDWSDTPMAIAAKAVAGQENPIETIVASRFYETQKYLIMTDHIRGAEIVVMNEKIWQSLSPKTRSHIQQASKEASDYGTKLMREEEADGLAVLKAKGMTVIDKDTRLNVDLFRSQARKVFLKRYGQQWANYFHMIEKMK